MIMTRVSHSGIGARSTKHEAMLVPFNVEKERRRPLALLLTIKWVLVALTGPKRGVTRSYSAPQRSLDGLRNYKPLMAEHLRLWITI